MTAWPSTTGSPSAASFTRTAHVRSSRSAKARVNRSGMCWTMTIGGASAGMAPRNSRMASVPPVEAPTAISLCALVRVAAVAARGAAARTGARAGAAVAGLPGQPGHRRRRG